MTFKAKHDGLCVECKEAIYQGDDLVWVDGQAAHVDCQPDADKGHVEGPTCPKCWQVKSVTGACGCEDD